MKRNVETIERTVTEEKVTYIAVDGTEFESEEECLKYEKTARFFVFFIRSCTDNMRQCVRGVALCDHNTTKYPKKIFSVGCVFSNDRIGCIFY